MPNLLKRKYIAFFCLAEKLGILLTGGAIGERAKMSALFQMTPTINATKTDSPLPPLEDLLTIFFSQHSGSLVEISSCVFVEQSKKREMYEFYAFW